MARFPIQYTGASLPSQTPYVRAHLDTDTGAGAVARAVGQLGGQAINIGIESHRADALAGIAQFGEAVDEEYALMGAELAKTTDPAEYASIMDRHFSRVSEVAGSLSNGLARKHASRSLSTIHGKWTAATISAATQRGFKNWDDALAVRKAKAIEGQLPIEQFNSFLQSGQHHTPEWREAQLDETAHQAQHYNAQQMSLFQWDKLLQMEETGGYALALQTWPKLRPIEWQQVVGMAVARKAYAQAHEAELTTAEMEQAYGAARTMDPAAVQAQVEQLVDENGAPVSETKKLLYMKVINNASSVWQKTGANPWEKTQNYPLLAKLRLAVINGTAMEDGKPVPVTLEYINNQAFADNTPQLSYDDWWSVVRQYQDAHKPATDPTKFRTSHPVFEEFTSRLNKLYMDAKTEAVEEGAELDYQTDYLSLERELAAVWGDSEAMEKAYQKVTKKRREAIAAKLTQQADRWHWLKDIVWPIAPSGKQRWGSWAPAPSVTTKEEPAPPGLEIVWARMSADERQSAKRLLARGVSAERIIGQLQ